MGLLAMTLPFGNGVREMTDDFSGLLLAAVAIMAIGITLIATLFALVEVL